MQKKNLGALEGPNSMPGSIRLWCMYFQHMVMDSFSVPGLRCMLMLGMCLAPQGEHGSPDQGQKLASAERGRIRIQTIVPPI